MLDDLFTHYYINNFNLTNIYVILFLIGGVRGEWK